MSEKVAVYSSYGGMIGPDGTGPVDPCCTYVSEAAYNRLAAENAKLRAALTDLCVPVQRMVDRLDSEPGNQIAVNLWTIKLDAARAALEDKP